MGFIKFLKDKNILNDEQIIEGMIYHYKNRKPLLEVLKEEEFLSDERLVDLLDQSLDERRSLSHLLLEDSVSQDKIDELMLKQEEQSGSFAGWMIDQSILDLGKLNSLIDEYRKEESQPVKDESPVKENNAGINLAALESLSELGITSDEDLEELKGGAATNGEVDEFPEDDSIEMEEENHQENQEENELSINSNGQLKVFFTDAKKTELNNIIKKLALGMNIDSIKDIHTEIYKLLGVSKICQEKLMIKLLETWERVITSIIEEKIDFSKNNFTMILKELKEGIALSWDLKEQLLIQGNVKKFIKEGTSKERYIKNIQTALGFMK